MSLIGPFTTYMQYLHQEEYPELLDDELPDEYSDWLGRLDREDIEIYAKDWIRNHCNVSHRDMWVELSKEFISDNHLNI